MRAAWRGFPRRTIGRLAHSYRPAQFEQEPEFHYPEALAAQADRRSFRYSVPEMQQREQHLPQPRLPSMLPLRPELFRRLERRAQQAPWRARQRRSCG